MKKGHEPSRAEKTFSSSYGSSQLGSDSSVTLAYVHTNMTSVMEHNFSAISWHFDSLVHYYTFQNCVLVSQNIFILKLAKLEVEKVKIIKYFCPRQEYLKCKACHPKEFSAFSCA